MEKLNKIKKEVMRLFPAIAIIVASLFMLGGDTAQIKMTVFQLTQLSLFLIFGHIVRRTMFPYLKLESLVSRLHESPIACAIGVLGGIVFICTILLCLVLLL